MPEVLVNGVTLHYRVVGAGEPIVLTAGGTASGETLLPLAESLADRWQVVLWDRRNTGASDLSFRGEGSQHRATVEDLHALSRHLGLGPAHVGGASWGCGLSLLMALRHPEDVRSLLLWQVGGGSTEVTARINQVIFGQYIDLARREGMEAVAAAPYYAERIAQNSRNRERLLAMAPDAFADVLGRWRDLNTRGAPAFVSGMETNEEEIAGITVPAMIMPGADDAHTPAQAERLHGLLRHSTLVPFPFPAEEASALRAHDAFDQAFFPRLANAFTDFLSRRPA